MNWFLHHWWLIFPAWIVFACIAGPLLGRWLARRDQAAAFQQVEQAFYGPPGEHPRTCGCRSCFEKHLRSGGIP